MTRGRGRSPSSAPAFYVSFTLAWLGLLIVPVFPVYKGEDFLLGVWPLIFAYAALIEEPLKNGYCWLWVAIHWVDAWAIASFVSWVWERATRNRMP